ncbi:tetratricopeptide repeat protein [Verrucomicrobiota bacterium]
MRTIAIHIVTATLLIGMSVSTARADYTADRQAALAMVAAKQHEQALAAFLVMGETAQNDYQRSDAFEQAAMCALTLQRLDEALRLADRIPLRPHARTVRMRLMAEQKQWQQIVDTFKDVDPSDWPRSAAGEAFYLRGLAYCKLKDLESARRDLTAAAQRRLKTDVFFELAGVCMALKRDVDAMDAWLGVQRTLKDVGGWQYYTSITARAGILLRNGKYNCALKELDKVNRTSGYWLVKCLKLRGAVLTAMDRKTEAKAIYEEALKTKGISDIQKKNIEAALNNILNPTNSGGIKP